MVEGGLGKLVKCLLFTATFLICVGGIAVFSVGIWASLQKVHAVEQLLGSELYTYAAFVFIATGAAIALISALGCCGALKENKFKLALYFLVLLIVFVLLIAGGIMGYLFKDEVEGKLLTKMESSVNDYGQKESITNAWNAIHIYFKCCGFSKNQRDGYLIWQENEYLKSENLTVPITCCKDMENPAPCQMDPKNNAHPKDCYVSAKDYFKENSKIVGGIGVGIACFLLIGMVLSCMLYHMLRR